jgi:methylglutaconyl-CoA hydratase
MTDPSPLAAGTVRVDVADGVASVRFGHPKGNSLPGALLVGLAEAIARAGRDPDARVILVRSEGSGPFCAGASFDELKAIHDPETGRRFFSGFALVILAMIRAPKLVVMRVQGKAAGGGVGVIAASDYAVAAHGADVKLSELPLGLGPFVVGPVIERKVGPTAFMALAVDGDWRSAEWAERHGLYAELLDTPSALDARVHELVRKLAGFSPDAMRRLKQVFWENTEHWPELLAARAAISGELVLSEHTRRAIGG